MKEVPGQIVNLQEYYGKILQGSKDLKTSACCLNGDSMPPAIRKAIGLIDDEILNRFYGCGSPIPPVLEGRTVLDLGCGTGKDVYISSYLAGPNGFVVGVDMTEEQLAIARRHINSQMKKFGFNKPNVEFKKGFIENLQEIGIESDSIDVVISNCVLNLSPSKKDVFSEIFRVLRPGGELFFSDVFAGRRIPEHLANDQILHGECLAGAMYLEDFRRLLRDVGCPDYRVVNRRKIDLSNPEIEAKIGMIDFYSITVRAFKLDTLEDICEDYGQVAVYQGTISDHPHTFEFDDHHTFITGKPMLVCGNTASMLADTRFAKHFKVYGDRSTHYGPFDCSPAFMKIESGEDNPGGACC